MKVELGSFGYPKDVVNIVKPVVESFDENDFFKFAREYSSFTLGICNKIESKELEPATADKYYMLIDLYISDNFPNVQLGEKIEKIMFEGMMLHDFGKDFGANLSLMRTLADELQSGS